MYSATNFSYDGIYSGIYGMQIATINGDPLEETPYVTPELHLSRPSGGHRFYYAGKTYAEAPSVDFTLITAEPMTDVVQREVAVWLDARSGFKPLIIDQPEHEDYVYNCIFTINDWIFHKGFCYGVNVTATFDSIYQQRTPREIDVKPDTTNTTTKETWSGGVAVDIFNDSDIIDGFVYPKVSFEVNDLTNAIKIINASDEGHGEFGFNLSTLQEKVAATVDNELKIIDSATPNLLKLFTRKWLRLGRGWNKLKVIVEGNTGYEVTSVKIVCPRYAKIRF